MYTYPIQKYIQHVQHVLHVQYTPRSLASCSILAFHSASIIIKKQIEVQDLKPKTIGQCLALIASLTFVITMQSQKTKKSIIHNNLKQCWHKC